MNGSMWKGVAIFGIWMGVALYGTLSRNPVQDFVWGYAALATFFVAVLS